MRKTMFCVRACTHRPRGGRSGRSDAISYARQSSAVCVHAHSRRLRHRLPSGTVWRLPTKRGRILCLRVSPVRPTLRLLWPPLLVAWRGAGLQLSGSNQREASAIKSQRLTPPQFCNVVVAVCDDHVPSQLELPRRCQFREAQRIAAELHYFRLWWRWLNIGG